MPHEHEWVTAGRKTQRGSGCLHHLVMCGPGRSFLLRLMRVPLSSDSWDLGPSPLPGAGLEARGGVSSGASAGEEEQ